MKSILQLWFGFKAPVNQRTYLVHGLILMSIKYGVDAIMALIVTGDRFLDPITYLHPLIGYRYTALMGEGLSPNINPTWWAFATIIWSLPFIWIGVSMSARRAYNAGMSMWIALLFFVPLINLILIAILCAQPSAAPRQRASKEQIEEGVNHLVTSALKAIGITSLLGLGLVALSVLGFNDYGESVFMGTPFVMGALGAYIVHKPTYRGWRIGLLVSLLSVTFCAGLMLVLALEGALCLVMAAPIAITLASLGALVGGAMVQASESSQTSMRAMVFAVPIFSMLGIGAPLVQSEYAVVTTIEVDAPPEVVWRYVVGFSELPPPSDWLLKTGVALPLRARIEGEGVGAIRYCEFTTGPFVEPITVWDYPSRLGFDVIEHPPSMEEWSPYQVVNAPHLIDSMVSRRGQFKLDRLPLNRTRLEGTTWYSLEMAPALYWTLWSDLLVHRIHKRVLRHVRAISEAEAMDTSEAL